jgi:drug/metabolite transporter (DMT)-like permease
VPLVAVALVLGAAACHTAWNLIFKSQSDRAEVSLGALVVGVLLTSPVLAVYSLREVSLEAWGLILLSGVLETAYVVLLTAAYQAGDLSLVYPIARGTPALVVVPLSVGWLGEPLSATGLLGIGLVVVGIFAAHLPGRRATDARAGGDPARAVVLALLTGLAISGYSFVNKLGVQRVPVPLYAALVFAVDAALLAVVLRARGGLRRPPARGRWKAAVAIGVLMMGAYLGVLGAMARAPLAYVVAAREVSIVMTTAAGVLLLGEGASWRRLGGAALIFAGLVAIALSR